MTMSGKKIFMYVAAVLLLAGAMHFYERTAERRRAKFLDKAVAALRVKSIVPMHNPPIERDIIALAEKDSSRFCHPQNGSADGCQLDATLREDHWIVFAWPYVGNPATRCCAVDSAHLFIYTRSGTFLREERGGP
jgi:hypothetical protein